MRGTERAFRVAVVAGVLLAGSARAAPAPGTTAAASPATAPDPELAAALAVAGPPASPGAAARVWQSLNPDLALIGDLALAWFEAGEPLQTGGHDPTRTGFHLQQLELSIGAAVDPYFRFDSNIVFALFGVEVEEAYATTLGLPAGLQWRVGQFLTRFGRVNSTHPHSWAFVDQAFMMGRVFGGEGNRGLGTELSVLMPLPWYVELVGAALMADGAATSRSFYGASDLGVRDPGDLLYVPALKQFFALSSDWSLNVGGSGAFGPNGTGRGNRSDVYGADLYLKYRPVAMAAPNEVAMQVEWLWRRRQVPADLYRDHGGYAWVAWRFAPRWSTAARYEYGAPIRDEAGRITADDLDPEARGERHRASVNLTFWPTEFSRLRLQGARDIATWRATADHALMLAAEFVLGAHGAHPF